VRPSTREDQRTHIRLHLAPELGRVRLRDLSPERVEKLEICLLDRGLSSATVLKVHRTLSRALKVALQRGFLARNVCTLVDPPRQNREEVEPLTKAEARRILAAASEVRNSARWSVALSLGLRQGEALGLCWDAVDLANGTVAIKQSLARSRFAHGCDRAKPCGQRQVDCPRRLGEPMRLEKPKSRAGERVVTLPRPLLEALRKQKAEQDRERRNAGMEWWVPPPATRGSSWDLVFRTVTGRPVQHSRDHKDWQALLVKAGVRRARLHDARHTAATLLLEMNVKPRIVMEILGHSSIGLTLNTYSHVMPELERAAAAQMAAALWGDEPDDVDI
jgi:integrase